MIIIINLHKLENETEEAFIWRLGQAKDSGLLEMDWDEIGDIINDECRIGEETYRGSSAYRKPYQYAKRFYEAGVFNNLDEESYFKELQEHKRELERTKIQYRDERNAWQKQNYADARAEQTLDYLEDELKKLGKINFETHSYTEINSDNDLLIQLSDWHIGQTFSSMWGEYNTDIAKERVEQLLNEIIKIQKRHSSQKAIVLLQGDMLSGNLHKSIQVTNRENLIDQIKIASELVASFCYELTKYFEVVHMYDVAGNHSRCDKKDDAIHDERLDCLISWSVSNILSHIENFHWMKHRNLDTGIADIIIRNKSYLACHGDYDAFTKNGVSQLSAMLGVFPTAILYGHLHKCSYDEENGVIMIRSGSLAGCGDQYTIEKRLIGKPSQMVTVCDDNGVICCYPIKLI